jgi:hypothetical protein
VHPGQISGRSARSSDVREVCEVREIHQLSSFSLAAFGARHAHLEVKVGEIGTI